MISEAEYDRLYASRPKTTRGRANRAALLIRGGRCSGEYNRAFDDCFEMGDGAQVMALLMETVREYPELKEMMKAQGVWSDDLENTPPPKPLVLTEEEKTYAFLKATGGMSGAAQRWRDRAAKGMTDEELAEALAFELGQGGSSGPDSLSISQNGAGLRIWASWDVQNIHTAKPVFAGKHSIAKAREVYRIRDPADRQLALF
ncbi:MAG: hypothetical protein IPK66_06135 [Rhodospirillales bacterium]|nr:hypothetical protein [Rhodospirillales bacterium]